MPNAVCTPPACFVNKRRPGKTERQVSAGHGRHDGGPAKTGNRGRDVAGVQLGEAEVRPDLSGRRPLAREMTWCSVPTVGGEADTHHSLFKLRPNPSPQEFGGSVDVRGFFPFMMLAADLIRRPDCVGRAAVDPM